MSWRSLFARKGGMIEEEWRKLTGEERRMFGEGWCGLTRVWEGPKRLWFRAMDDERRGRMSGDMKWGRKGKRGCVGGEVGSEGGKRKEEGGSWA